jgi:hypothetical protein
MDELDCTSPGKAVAMQAKMEKLFGERWLGPSKSFMLGIEMRMPVGSSQPQSYERKTQVCWVEMIHWRIIWVAISFSLDKGAWRMNLETSGRRRASWRSFIGRCVWNEILVSSGSLIQNQPYTLFNI